MKTEALLKSISNLLKKHESFLNNNPEFFHAIENRLLKALDDEEDSDYDWANSGKDAGEDEEEYGSGYGDDLFDDVPSDDRKRKIKYDAEGNGVEVDDDEEDGDIGEDGDEASKWLAQHGKESDGEQDGEEGGFDFDPKAGAESDVDLDEDEVVPPKIPKKVKC